MIERQATRHGNPPHSDLVNGPAEDRRCTDILCCLLFILGVIGMIYFSIIGYRRGQPVRLSFPYDPDDQACGYDKAVLDFPFIYLVTPLPGYFGRSVCVKKCPQYMTDSAKPISLDCFPNQLVPSCNENTELQYEDLYASGTEAATIYLNQSVYIYNSTGLFGRFCLPSMQPYLSEVTSIINLGFLQEWMSDLSLTWPVLLSSAGVAFLIGFIYMILVRFCSGVMTWLSIFFYLALVVLIGYFFFEKSQTINQGNNKPNQKTLQMMPISSKNKQIFYYILLSDYGSLAQFHSLSLFFKSCFFNQIRLAIAILKSATLFIKDVPIAVVLPIIFGIVMIFYWAFWVSSMIYIYAVGDITGRNDSPFATIKWATNIRYLLIFQIFQGIWCNELIHAMCEFILASSCAIWYFTLGTGQDLVSPFGRSIKRGFFYHLGSLAFGALILTLVQLIRIWLEYIHKQLQNAGQADNQPMKCECSFLDCLRCYASYFERFVEFLNKNAYIQIAISGKSFIPAAKVLLLTREFIKDAFWLIYTNPTKFAILNGIGGIVIGLGKYFIALITTFACYIFLTQTEYYKGMLFSPLCPCIFCYLIALMVGHIFMIVYGMGMDTILQCFCLDEELQKQNMKPAQHCPAPLRQFFEEQETKN